MSFAKHIFAAVLCVCTASACGNNLLPSSSDKRPAATAGTTGHLVGQNAPSFSMKDTQGNTVTLGSLLAAGKPVVIYFTMWCPICDSHMQNMQAGAMQSYPNVTYTVVDYVSGSVAAASASQSAAGYGGASFAVLVDEGQIMLGDYHATMGTTIVIDTGGVIKMNEDYKDGAALLAVLGAL